jgi:acyl-CoA synthetase (AMP-forming)/AMP-acid ligase II
MIMNGVNYNPQYIEAAAQDASETVRPGCVATFSSDDTDEDGEVEVVFEIRTISIADVEAVAKAVRVEVSQQIGVTPTRVVTITEKSIPKTTSGKIQRRATRANSMLFLIGVM